jgi:hypothetical protein
MGGEDFFNRRFRGFTQIEFKGFAFLICAICEICGSIVLLAADEWGILFAASMSEA